MDHLKRKGGETSHRVLVRSVLHLFVLANNPLLDSSHLLDVTDVIHSHSHS